MTNKKMYKKVVEHWFEIWKAFKDGKIVDIYQHSKYIKMRDKLMWYNGSGCAYCKAYMFKECKPCPIYIKTRFTNCRETPWPEFAEDPSKETAFNFLEFVRKTPPKGVEIIELKDLEI